MLRATQIPGWMRISAAAVLSVFLLLLVAASLAAPFLAMWLGGPGWGWSRLADIGQAYGGVSALLTGLGFSGIAISLLMQRRQNRLMRLYSIRDRQFDLVKLALDNPEFLYTEDPAIPSDPEASRKVYANLQVGHWALLWDLGILKAPTLRVLAKRLFRTPFARDWWRAWGKSYLDYRPRRFFDIVDRECSAATAASKESEAPAPPQEPPESKSAVTSGHTPAAPSRTVGTTSIRAVVVGIGVGLVAGQIGRYALRRWTR